MANKYCIVLLLGTDVDDLSAKTNDEDNNDHFDENRIILYLH